MQSAERVSGSDMSDNYVFQRSIAAYYRAAELVEGVVVEIGTGSGYGIELIAPHADRFITVDKHRPPQELLEGRANVEFRKMTVPPLTGFDDNSADCVIMFQVIEHIRDDRAMIAEIARILKPDGRLIVSTPNRPMSLTRNPWHVREYSADEFGDLLSERFATVERWGVAGNRKVMEYYEQNRQGVERVSRIDVLDLQHRLPRVLLQIPYDILNRINRRRLLRQNNSLTASIGRNDYSFEAVSEQSFDLFYVASKKR